MHEHRHMMEWLIRGVRVVMLFALFMCLVVTHVVCRPVLREPLPSVARFFYRMLLAIMGIHVCVQGVRYRRACLFVANHASWLDIPIMGMVLPDVRFVAKETLLLSRVFRIFSWWHPPLFVQRHRRFDVREQRDRLSSQLMDGKSLMLFAEGYATDGNKVREFKSSLFDAAYAHDMKVQPVSIAYSHMDGTPVRQMMRSTYAWYGHMRWIAHVWRLLSVTQSLVTMRFYTPMVSRAASSRKDLAHRCCLCVRQGVAQDLYGIGGEKHAMEYEEKT